MLLLMSLIFLHCVTRANHYTIHTEGDLQQFGSINPPSKIWFLDLFEAPCAAWMLRWVFVLLSNVGWRETTPSAHSLRSHQSFLRLVTQGHISSKALEMFAGISNLLGIFTAHLDESSKNIATLLKITIKFFGSINYLPSYIGLGFFLPVLHVQGRKEFQIQHFVYKLVCQTTLQWFITVFHPAVVPRFPLRIISPAFGRKTDDDFSRLLPAHLVKEKLQF